MLKILICEDDIIQLEQIESFLLSLKDENSFDYEVVCITDDPHKAFCYIEENHADVFFLDIDFKTDINGLELADKIKKANINAYIIFISEHLNFVFSSFKVHPFDFLPKPITKNVLKKTIEEIIFDNRIRNEKSKINDKILVRQAGAQVYIDKQDIIFIERVLNKTIIHTTANNYHTYQSLDFYDKALVEDGRFVRCHRAYLVNKHYINEVDRINMQISLNNGDACYIGRKYKKFLD